MSDALFELETPVWEPVWLPRIEDVGWHWDKNPSRLSIVVHEDGTKVSREEWRQFTGLSRCRDCGAKCSFNSGGGRAGRSYQVCDPCTQLDGAHVHCCRAARCEPFMEWSWTVAASCLDCTWTMWTERFVADGEPMETEPIPAAEIDAAIAHHNRAHYVSHWGSSHELGQHDNLVRLQAQRRAKYLREVAA